MKRRMRLKNRYGLIYRFSKRDILVIILFLVLLCTFFIFHLLNKYIAPILLDYAEIETTKLSTLIINKAVENQVSNNFKVEDMIKTTLNKNGEIVSVDFDTNIVNQSLVSINNTIQSNLRYLEEGKLNLIDMPDVSTSYDLNETKAGIIYQIPFGVITDTPIIADIGPKIPVKTSLIGSVISNVKTELTSYGINNALLKIYIEVTVTEQVILPFISKRINISLEVPVLMKLINGSIPEVYGNGYSVTSPITGSE